MERGFYDTKNKPKRESFKYKQEGRFYLGVAKAENQDGTIIDKRCLVSDDMDKKIVTIDALQKRHHERICKNKEAYFVVITMVQ